LIFISFLPARHATKQVCGSHANALRKTQQGTENSMNNDNKRFIGTTPQPMTKKLTAGKRN
jgi:hypothetical protein